MSDFVQVKSKANLESEAAVHQLAKAYLDSTSLNQVLLAKKRLLEVLEVAQEQQLVTSLEIWKLEPQILEGAWRLTKHSEEVALELSKLQDQVEQEFPEVQFSLRWLKA